MRYYYDNDFIHIIEHHQDDIMDNLKSHYNEDVFDIIRELLDGAIAEQQVIFQLNERIIAAAELVYENHA